MTRQQLEKALRRRLSDSQWEYLVRKRFVASYQDGEDKLSDLVREARDLIATGSPVAQEPAEPTMLDLGARDKMAASDGDGVQERLRTLAIGLAAIASRDKSVAAFRKEHLSQGLLYWPDMEGWIERKALEDGPATTWLDQVPVPPDRELCELSPIPALRIGPSPGLTIDSSYPAHGAGWRQLQYALPGHRAISWENTRDEGVLDRLRTISEALAQEYNWQEAQATTFVLTGRAPFVSGIRVTVPEGRPIAISRIVLDIDPTEPPERVAEKYRQARQRILPKAHSLSVKHLRLLRWWIEHGEREAAWSGQMQQWNQHAPSEWHYTSAPHFRRDCLAAYQRLLKRAPQSISRVHEGES